MLAKCLKDLNGLRVWRKFQMIWSMLYKPEEDDCFAVCLKGFVVHLKNACRSFKFFLMFVVRLKNAHRCCWFPEGFEPIVDARCSFKNLWCYLCFEAHIRDNWLPHFFVLKLDFDKMKLCFLRKLGFWLILLFW